MESVGLWLAQEPAPIQPITIHNIAPDPGWLTQPVATLIAAGIALLAACIAWAGVQKQIAATRISSQRADCLAALQDAAAALIELRTASRELIWRRQMRKPRGLADLQSELNKALAQSTHARAKLMLLGLNGALEIYNEEIRRMAEIRQRADTERALARTPSRWELEKLIRELNEATGVYRQLASGLD